MSGTVYVDTVTGELKYQGTSGTPGIIADSSGNVPFSTSQVRIVGAAGVLTADLSTFQSIGNFTLNPSEYFAGNTKITRTVTFQAILHASTGVTSEVRLYNLTAGAAIAGTTLSSSASSATTVSSSITVGTTIPNSLQTYEVQLRISVPSSPSPGDTAFCSWAGIVFTYASS